MPISRYNKNFYYKEILNFQIDSRVIRDTEEKYACNFALIDAWIFLYGGIYFMDLIGEKFCDIYIYVYFSMYEFWKFEISRNEKIFECDRLNLS